MGVPKNTIIRARSTISIIRLFITGNIHLCENLCFVLEYIFDMFLYNLFIFYTGIITWKKILYINVWNISFKNYYALKALTFFFI